MTKMTPAEYAAMENAAMHRMYGRPPPLGVGVKKKCPKVAARRAQVIQMRDEGLSISETARRLGVREQIVAHDRNRGA